MSKFGGRGLKTLVLADNVNLYVSCKTTLRGAPDHEKLLLMARAGNPLFRAIAYSVRHSDRKMDHWIKTIVAKGWEVREKDVICRHDGTTKADWDVDICMDAWRMLNQYDMLVLITGDGDFEGLVRRIQEHGKIVRAIAVPKHTAQSLIDAVDEFIPFTEDMLLLDNSSSTAEDVDEQSLGEAFRTAGIDTDQNGGDRA